MRSDRTSLLTVMKLQQSASSAADLTERTFTTQAKIAITINPLVSDGRKGDTSPAAARPLTINLVEA